MAALSGTNVQIADNLCNANRARASAESGLEIVRFWLSNVAISGTTPIENQFDKIANSLQIYLAANNPNVTPYRQTVPLPNGPYYASLVLHIPSVALDSDNGHTFSAQIAQIDPETLRLTVTGAFGSFTKTISVNYVFGQRANTVFNYGVATKGPLTAKGNVTIAGVNIAVEANAYIESLNNFVALTMIGNSQIAGDVKIVNPLTTADIGTSAGVAGDTGADAMKHIEIGVPAVEFPEMMPAVFYSYATNVLTPSINLKKAVTLTNIRIPAGMNPKFNSATLNGVIFIESPNVVEFTGGVDITGVIVTNGSPTDDSGTNQLIFRGHASNHSVALLPQEAQFAGLRSQTGTFIIAPGFSVSFGGTFDTIGGAIAANGVEFFGNAGGTIRGSVINYADKPMMLWGNTSIMFNRSGITEAPAGFVPEIILEYDPDSYSEI
jgi:hypothetical protein